MQAEQQRTVSASYIVTLLDVFTEALGGGKARGEMLAETGIDPRSLLDPDARLPVAAVSRLWQIARDSTHDRLLGLRVGAHIRPGSFSVLGHLLMTCATLRDALDQTARFAVLVGDGGVLTMDKSSRAVELRYDLVDRNLPCREERIEAILACLVAFASWITGTRIVPEIVRFAHESPGEEAAYRRVFGIDPVFEQADNAVAIAPSDLDRPLTQANAALSTILTNHAETMLSQLTTLDPFLHGLRQRLLIQLPGQPPELEETAAVLGMTGRSLQRKLSTLDTSFQEELTALRRDTAFNYLHSHLPIREIAYLLGFSDTANFHKAFKRWTGVTPKQWQDGDKPV